MNYNKFQTYAFDYFKNTPYYYFQFLEGMNRLQLNYILFYM